MMATPFVSERNTKYACWTDPDAALERMTGPHWTRALKDETTALQTYIKAHPDVLAKTKSYSARYKEIAEEEEPLVYAVDNTIGVEIRGHHIVCWWWLAQTSTSGLTLEPPTKTYADNVWITHGYVISVEDIGHGDHTYIMKIYNGLSRKLVWSMTGIGEYIGVVGDRLYTTLVKNRLWNYAVLECNLTTGKERRIVVRAENERENCYVYRWPGGVVYAAVEDSQEWRWYALPTFKRAADPYKIPAGIQTPRGSSYGLEWSAPQLGLYITKKHGSHILWHLTRDKQPRELLRIPAGSILVDPFALRQSITKETIPIVLPLVVLRPDTKRLHYRIHFREGGIPYVSRLGAGLAQAGNGLAVERRQTESADGTVVHYLLVQSRRVAKPVKLLAVGYGAYALATYTGMLKRRWGPWLEAGWGLAVGFIRGGGDHDEAWAQAGRRWGRKKTHEDMEAVIRAAQKAWSIGPRQSCIYGRSAGGYLVGALLARNPGGELFRGVYTEVPYVDVLQTTTNPALPLTRIEYGEFGNPAESLADFIYVGLTSPATAAAAQSCPGVFVLARTAAHDSQVYTYEAIKWIRRLRANAPYGEAKLCIVEGEQGHFTPPESEAAQYGLDLALVEAAFQA